jgi:hypothetical protein
LEAPALRVVSRRACEGFCGPNAGIACLAPAESRVERLSGHLIVGIEDYESGFRRQISRVTSHRERLPLSLKAIIAV